MNTRVEGLMTHVPGIGLRARSHAGGEGNLPVVLRDGQQPNLKSIHRVSFQLADQPGGRRVATDVHIID